MQDWRDDPEERRDMLARMVARMRALASGSQGTLRRLAGGLRRVTVNQRETRRLLASEVYRVPEDELDEAVRRGMEDKG